MHVHAHSANRLLQTRNGYTAAIALLIVFTALYSASLPGRDMLSASLHALTDFKVMWVCALVAGWRLIQSPSAALNAGQLYLGALTAALAASTAGLWPWLILIAFAFGSLRNIHEAGTRQALYLVLAIGVHEALVTLCAEMFSERLLNLDALIAQTVTRWALPEVAVTGATLEIHAGHSIVLVWGCSSLSYIGDMVLLCAALSLFLMGEQGVNARIWAWLMLVAALTVVLNSFRLVLMASAPEYYELLHAGAGAALFRVGLISGATAMAWLYYRHAHV